MVSLTKICVDTGLHFISSLSNTYHSARHCIGKFLFRQIKSWLKDAFALLPIHLSSTQHLCQSRPNELILRIVG